MAALLDQLRQLHKDLEALMTQDSEQEVQGMALPLIDAVLSEARKRLPDESTLRNQIVELISPESIANGESIRAADALIVVGQLLAALDHYESPNTPDLTGLRDATEALSKESYWRSGG